VLLKTCFSGLKCNRWVGDFQVATGGGFWVATRDLRGMRLCHRFRPVLRSIFGWN